QPRSCQSRYALSRSSSSVGAMAVLQCHRLDAASTPAIVVPMRSTAVARRECSNSGDLLGAPARDGAAAPSRDQELPGSLGAKPWRSERAEASARPLWGERTEVGAGGVGRRAAAAIGPMTAPSAAARLYHGSHASRSNKSPGGADRDVEPGGA